MTAPIYAVRLSAVVAAAEPQLTGLDESESASRPAPGKWSQREILGHLIDSASNNHQRFVRAADQDDLVFPGYAQESWVAVQRYQEAPWRDVITLWASFNRHIARVMAAVPEAVRMRQRVRHNLHEISWNTVPQGVPATLDYFMADYVRHLEHHLRQILGEDWEQAHAELNRS